MTEEQKMKIRETYTSSFGKGDGRPVYFIGIGGIGMSAVAKFFNANGFRVSGYDKVRTVVTDAMEAEGISIHFEENITMVPLHPFLVVYTPAIQAEHKELMFCRESGYNVVKRSDILKLITESSFNICVAGTHGKTTISTMVAHLLRHSGFGCNAFLGGVSVNYSTNFWKGDNNVCVVEADEYDRSFLKLFPDMAVVTAMDADHLDIYGTAEAVQQAFIDFTGNIKPGGMLFKQFGLKRGKELQADQCISYSLQNESADAYAADIMIEEGGYDFNVVIKNKKVEGVRLNMGGMHNVENAVAAIAIASSLEIEDEKIRKAVADFKGVKRRFEYVLRNSKVVFIDDYAHHPEELKALINGAKTLFKERKCTVIFQPHLYTRTRDLADGFAEALDLADQVLLLPIYPARELPLENVSSKMILDRMKNDNKACMEKEELVRWIIEKYKTNLNPEFGEMLIIAGAGDIDLLVEPIKNVLNQI
ncbi:MAG TPA: UDP-N-acetylmuramate--L-alanine ligase [Chitinophagaceae bacterium]|nr:UDP-N-acetylmuramate--L-alanine ligase [Chitinophagaceae bacterium]